MTADQLDRAERCEARRRAQRRNLFGRVQAAASASRTQAQRLLRAKGDLSITEWRVLWDLAEAGPLTVTEMASIQRTDHALVSRAVPSLAKKGLVTTTTGADDRRTSSVALTPAGRSAFEATAGTMSARRAALAATFSQAEMDTFLDLIGRFERFVEGPVPPLAETGGA
ncbi:MarR family transcriptional regulator [Jannaschia sp. Os4]|uniref:MarR family winged helix-turn-helix transcriptional regulator n=1 Tax=Jannaschia sp. Os4 TaxID=2807617 RepID=UPI0019397C3C|nr:MarR family transcriptional regulator [Jannaschia sp. Os4]MBM2576370.1 MarR family transcriptional regulator [Jannaschia sp. Os4]